MSDLGVGVQCRQCGTDDPMADKLGWLMLCYEHVPEPHAIFCGGLCAEQWLQAARERLFRAVIFD
jgi:hypothetical protein